MAAITAEGSEAVVVSDAPTVGLSAQIAAKFSSFLRPYRLIVCVLTVFVLIVFVRLCLRYHPVRGVNLNGYLQALE